MLTLWRGLLLVYGLLGVCRYLRNVDEVIVHVFYIHKKMINSK